MPLSEFQLLKHHVGHNIECVCYGTPDETLNISIECIDCNEVLYSIDKECSNA